MIEDTQTAIRKLIDDIDAAEKHILALRMGRFENPGTRLSHKLIEALDAAAQMVVKVIADTKPSTRFVSRGLVAALKDSFPDIKFAVRTTEYINVKWVEGPTEAQVEEVLCGIGAEWGLTDRYSSRCDIMLDERKVYLDRVVPYVEHDDDDDDNNDIVDAHAEAAE